jgi:hypothetical protein
VAISTNNWYRFSLSVVQNAASQDFTLTGTVEDYGISGTNSPVLLGSTGMTRENAYMLATPRVYAGLGAISGRNGYSKPQFDNFQANGVTCSTHRAEATAQIASGLVTGITVVDGGCGYTNTQVGLVKAVKPSFSDLLLGTHYQLQTSGDLITWTNQGSPFTATNPVMAYPAYFDVDNWDQLFFRVEVTP